MQVARRQCHAPQKKRKPQDSIERELPRKDRLAQEAAQIHPWAGMGQGSRPALLNSLLRSRHTWVVAINGAPLGLRAATMEFNLTASSSPSCTLPKDAGPWLAICVKAIVQTEGMTTKETMKT
eukprot:1162108-Pelagomonas_calceolata.AAC.8